MLTGVGVQHLEGINRATRIVIKFICGIHFHSFTSKSTDDGVIFQLRFIPDQIMIHADLQKRDQPHTTRSYNTPTSLIDKRLHLLHKIIQGIFIRIEFRQCDPIISLK